MGRIVILEGPDGSGKTALARELVRSHHYEYLHIGAPREGEDVLLSYALTLYNAEHSRKKYVIDRLHLGETIYGPIMRGVDQIGQEGLDILNRMIVGYGALVIVCLPPFHVAKKNWQERRAMEYVLRVEQYRAIYEAYVKSAIDNAYHVWDYTSHPPVDDLLMTFPRLRCPDNVVGSPKPRFLVVGEKANQKQLDVPWVSLSGSSHYLYTCLQEAGFQEHEMAFMNAMRLDNTPNDVVKAWTILDRPTPVLLGMYARDSMHRAHLPKEWIVHHPAYWKRFHAYERSIYVAKLREIHESRDLRKCARG